MDKAEIAVTHDFYLKKFQLIGPVLPYDYILFDEGQDASPAMLDVFLKQQAIKIIVGDRHQQIYGWRFAINSLEQVDFPIYNLSSSFRFDDEIALVANKILAWKKQLQQPAAVKIIGAGNSTGIIQSKATLGRTNLGLLLNAIAQWQQGGIQKLYFEGNINSYTFADEGASLYDVLNLHNGKRDKIKDRLIAGMKDIRELQSYIEKSEDSSLSVIVEVVKEFGDRLPGLIAELKKNHAETKEEADMIFSTVHRCKGMEYDEVTLLNDFINEEKLKKNILQYGNKIPEADKNRLAEEVNILYVAVTRAKNKLNIPAAINPLQSINVSTAAELQPVNSYKKTFTNDWELYSSSQNTKSAAGKKFNRGKKWSEEEKDLLEDLYNKNIDINEMANLLGRGRSGVRIKLVDLGLLDESNSF